MPDVFVPRDTSLMTPWYNKVVNRAYTYQFAHDYTNRNRSTLAQFKTFAAMEKHLKGTDCLSRFVDFCKTKGIEPDARQINKSKPLIERLIYSYIVRNMLGEKEFYPLFERDDEMTKKAIETLMEQIEK